MKIAFRYYNLIILAALCAVFIGCGKSSDDGVRPNRITDKKSIITLTDPSDFKIVFLAVSDSTQPKNVNYGFNIIETKDAKTAFVGKLELKQEHSKYVTVTIEFNDNAYSVIEPQNSINGTLRIIDSGTWFARVTSKDKENGLGIFGDTARIQQAEWYAPVGMVLTTDFIQEDTKRSGITFKEAIRNAQKDNVISKTNRAFTQNGGIAFFPQRTF